MSARIHPVTVVAAVALLLGFGLDFVGWSNVVDREPLVSLAGVMLLLMLLFVAGGVRRIRYLAIPYTLALAIWAWLQWQTHWSTYVLPASEAKLRWYGRAFGGHWHLLPERAGYTTPDAYHTILAALIVVNLALALRDIFTRAG